MLKFLFRLLIVVGVLAGATYAAYGPAAAYLKERNRPKFRTAAVSRGDVVALVKSTGTVKPVSTVRIGAFVSGPIVKLHANFNDEVEEGQLLAEIDPLIYDANVARDQAGLATRVADVARVKARLQNATNDEKRSIGLKADNPNFISDTEMDQFRFAKQALEAEFAFAEASVKQAEAALKTSLANLHYTKIVSPVSGIVIDRKIDPGQTLASQFQTPELFIVAPNMRDEMHIFASVDEADIGFIREAKSRGQKVLFTVDAYRDEVFEGSIYQIRLSSIVTQGVVTYPVVVSASNADLKLLPGMTANLSFRVEEKQNVIKVPNSALRYYPKRDHVREADRHLLDGTEEGGSGTPRTAADLVVPEADQERRRRHVWVQDGDFLRAIEVETGISDYIYTEIISGDLPHGTDLIIGEKVVAG